MKQTTGCPSTANKTLRSSLHRTRLRHRGYALALTLVVIALVVGVNFLATALQNRFALTIDASSNKITDFSPTTYSVLDSIEQPIQLYLLFSEGTRNTLRINLEEIAQKFHARNNNIAVSTIDPVKNPNRIKQLVGQEETISEGSIILTNGDASRVKLVQADELYTVWYDQGGNPIVSGFNGEAKMISALMFVNSDVTPVVHFLTGHGEVAFDQMSLLTNLLIAQNFAAMPLTMAQETMLARGDVVVIVNPMLDLREEEYVLLRNWLDDGGRMFFAADPSVDFGRLANFAKLLNYYALSFMDGVVVEDNASASNWIYQQDVLVPTINKTSEYVREIANVDQMMLPNSRAIKAPGMPLSGFVYEPLLTTSSNAYIKESDSTGDLLTRGPEDEIGQQTLSMAVLHQRDVRDSTRDTRIILLGNVFPVANNETMAQSHNLFYALASMEWLVNRQTGVYVPSKPTANTTLAIPNAATLWTLVVIVVGGVPLMTITVGMVVWLRRRRL